MINLVFLILSYNKKTIFYRDLRRPRLNVVHIIPGTVSWNNIPVKAYRLQVKLICLQSHIWRSRQKLIWRNSSYRNLLTKVYIHASQCATFVLYIHSFPFITTLIIFIRLVNRMLLNVFEFSFWRCLMVNSNLMLIIFVL